MDGSDFIPLDVCARWFESCIDGTIVSHPHGLLGVHKLSETDLLMMDDFREGLDTWEKTCHGSYIHVK